MMFVSYILEVHSGIFFLPWGTNYDLCVLVVFILCFSLFSICSLMGIIGDGLMTAQAAGAVTVLQTTVPLTLHGEQGRAVSALQLDAGDILCSLTLWYRYAQTHSRHSFKMYIKQID